MSNKMEKEDQNHHVLECQQSLVLDPEVDDEQEPQITTIQVMVVGNSHVGKTSLIHSFIHDQPQTVSPKPTVGVDFFTASSLRLHEQGSCVRAQILDTSGHEKYRRMIKGYWSSAQAIIFAYDINSRSSFEDVKKWVTLFKEDLFKDSSTPLSPGAPLDVSCDDDNDALPSRIPVLMLVGNKVDLATHEARQVSAEEAADYASSEVLLFVETSAVSGHHVDMAFQLAISEGHHRHSHYNATLSRPRPSRSRRHTHDFVSNLIASTSTLNRNRSLSEPAAKPAHINPSFTPTSPGDLPSPDSSTSSHSNTSTVSNSLMGWIDTAISKVEKVFISDTPTTPRSDHCSPTPTQKTQYNHVINSAELRLKNRYSNLNIR